MCVSAAGVTSQGGVEMLRGHVLALDQLSVPGGGSMLGMKVDPTGSGHLKPIPFLPRDRNYNGPNLFQVRARVSSSCFAVFRKASLDP